MNPVIAIIEPASSPEYNARTYAHYAAGVETAGGRALRIPLDKTPRELMAWATQCHAVLLPGSRADVDPQKYGALRSAETVAPDPARDVVDELFLQDAYNMRKPVLGICYGVQILNVFRSGTLVQHLPEEPVKHSAGGGERAHQVAVEQDSKLAQIVGATQIPVNSSHHQALDVVGDGLRVVARCTEDGVIEAVEGTDPAHWVMGVQWHPERGFDKDEPSQKIFHALVDAATAWKRSPRAANEPERISR